MKKILLFLLVLACFSVNAQKRIIGANNVVTILAGQAIPNWTLVRITGGKAYPANNLKIDSAAVAISIDTAFVANDTIQVAYGGILQGFAVEKGKDYFLGTSGTLTATKPTAAFTQKVGSWVEDSTLQLSIQQALPLIVTGTYTQTVDEATTLTVTIPTQPNTNYRVFIVPKNELSAVLWWVPESGKTTTSFDITFNIALTGLISGEVSFDWQIIQN